MKGLFLDDIRDPSDVYLDFHAVDWTVARTVEECIFHLYRSGNPVSGKFNVLSLDHDLGDEPVIDPVTFKIERYRERKNGNYVCKFLVNNQEFLPYKIILHTANHIGAENMTSTLSDLHIPIKRILVMDYKKILFFS